MPQATMREESEYPVPENTPVPCILTAVTIKTVEFFKKDEYGNKTNVKDSFDKWKWEFKVTDGEYKGLKLYGETEDKLSTRADNLVRPWAETLRGKAFEVGEGLNTDDLIGLPCLVEVKHGDPWDKRDGTKFYPCDVADVYPSSGDYSPQPGANQYPWASSPAGDSGSGWSDEPPF